MGKYVKQVPELRARFENFEIQHIPRSENHKVDYLAQLSSVAGRGEARKITLLTAQCSVIEV